MSTSSDVFRCDSKNEEKVIVEDSVPKRIAAEERQAALHAAMAIDPGVRKFSWRAIQMYLIALISCCCSGGNGFDGTVMSGVNAMSQYQNYFGMDGAGSSTSIVFGIFTIGSLCGLLPAFYLPDRIGRRRSMWFGSAVLIIGACIAANAKDRSPFLGGRFLSGFGSSCASASANSYLAELSPPQHRGAYIGFFNSFYYVGQTTATGMMVATNKWDSELSWRLPLYAQVIPAALNFLFIFFCPESPRWLYSVGKEHRAREILARLHSSTGDVKSPLVELEMQEIREKIAVDGADKRWWDFRPLFRSRADRRRMYLVIMIGAFGQLSGNGMITYFLPLLLKQAGIKSQNKQLTLTFVNSITSYIGALTGSFTIDRYGRRKILLISSTLITCLLAVVTGLLSSFWDSARSNTGIAFIYLFMVFFSFGWTPMQALYPVEVLAYEGRVKGLAIGGIVVQAASCINTFGLPVALEKISWKVYLIFMIWDMFETIIIYLFLVETKGLTLEEINEVFDATNPRAYSLEITSRKKGLASSSEGPC